MSLAYIDGKREERPFEIDAALVARMKSLEEQITAKEQAIAAHKTQLPLKVREALLAEFERKNESLKRKTMDDEMTTGLPESQAVAAHLPKDLVKEIQCAFKQVTSIDSIHHHAFAQATTFLMPPRKMYICETKVLFRVFTIIARSSHRELVCFQLLKKCVVLIM
jgi:hypothetical protein